MEPTDKANSEAARLSTLHSCRVLDTEAELIYDDITRLLALTCSLPISVISLVDEDRLWLKSKVGVASSEVARDTSFCTHTIVQPDILVVPDTLQDPRFCDNPKVRGKPNLRFYAGAPIVMSNGQAIGAVAVMDTQPRELTREQRETLLAMARQVASHLELRRRIHEQEEVRQRLEQATERLDLVVAAAGAGIWDLDLDLDSLFVSERVFEMLGLLGTVGQVPLSAFWPIVHADDRRTLARAAIRQLRRGNAFDCELRCRHAQHGWRWYRARAIAAKSPQGGVRRLVGSLLDIHEQRRAQDSLQRVSRLLAESQALGRVGGWEWDLASDTLFWTSETYRIYEVSPADYQPTVDTAVAYFVPESRLRVRAALQDAVARGRAFSLELELVTARGRNIWVRATGGTVFAGGKAVRVLGAFQNITEQRQLVAAMGGTIGVASEIGVGSTFWFELLMASADSQAGACDGTHQPSVPATENQATNGRRVLVAEDNRRNLRLAVRVLETFGLQVDTAVDGDQAARLVCENDYDLVLMDCLMPDVDGFEATRRIRRHEVATGAHIPIIALTANALPEDREACLVAGMDDFVTKPFTRHALLQAIERWLQPMPARD